MKSNWLCLYKTDLHRNSIISPEEKLYTLKVFFKILLSYNGHILFLIRIASCSNKLFSKIARRRLKSRFSIDIGQNIRIGSGFILPHPMGIVLGNDITIGDDVIIGQHVSIGGNLKKYRLIGDKQRKMPIVGSRVFIAAGSVLAGPVVIGDDVIIGANSVITRDVPSNSIAYGANKLDTRKINFNHNGSYNVIQDDD